MSRKTQFVRKIDRRSKSTGGRLPFKQEENILPPAIRTLPAPDTLVEVSQGIIRSAQAPLAYVVISWTEAPNISPDYYGVEWSESSSFTDPQRARANQLSATIEGLKVNQTYYFRVQAVQGGAFSDYSETLSVLTLPDTTVPDVITGLSASFIKSDLVITWTKPTDETFKDVEIKIYNSGHTILYGTFYSGSQQFIWTAEQNLEATSNVGLTSVSIDVKSRSWSNVFSAAVNTTATSTAPAVPTGITSNWTSDDGKADEDVIVSWLAVTDANTYELILDGITYPTPEIRFTYRYDRNVQDHISILASGDPNLSYNLRAKNKLNQYSTTASGNLTNTAPSGSLFVVSAVAGFSQIAAQVSILSNAIVQDFDHYEWALVSGAITYQSFISTTPDVIFAVSSGGSYQTSVKVVDKFNQKSSAITSSIVVVDGLTLAELRAEAAYTDNLNTNVTSLKTAMSDDNRSSGGISYASNAGWVNWIRFTRPLFERYRTITLSMTPTSGTTGWYIRTSSDAITWRYFSGTVTSGRIPTEVASEAAARLAAVDSATLGNSSASRVDLPSILEARYVELWLRNTSASTRVDEFYPRRLVQSDDIEAESIKAVNIAASTITADKIAVFSLSAATASIEGVISVGTNGGLYQGSGTFASPTTGLKIFNSGGVGKLSTYNSGTEQVTLDTDGVLKAGAGNVLLAATGVELLAPTQSPFSYVATRSVKWTNGGNFVGAVQGYVRSGVRCIRIVGNDGSASNDGAVEIVGTGSGSSGLIQVVGGTAGNDGILLQTTRVDIIGDTYFTGNTSISAGINVGSATGAGTGQIVSSDVMVIAASDAGTTNVASGFIARHLSSGTPAAGFGVASFWQLHSSNNTLRTALQMNVTWATATDASRKARTQILINDTASREVMRWEASGTAAMIGFLGAGAVAKQTVTGVRTGTLAQLQTVVANMLTAFSNYGLITDSTT